MTTEPDRRIIVDASAQSYPGWRQTQQDELDLTREADWARIVPPGGLDAILMGHVRDHLSLEEAAVAARNCCRALAPGGHVRRPVPDGRFPDVDYQRTVQVVGPGPTDHPAATHRVVYTGRTLPPVFKAVGFLVRLVEW